MLDKAELKATLNLPKTAFPMRGAMAQREPEMLKQWEERDIHGKIQEASKDRPTFVLHDGPPYANGHIHYGHILNKVLKDIVVRYQTMRGRRAIYIPGWDCHGLPIELQVVRNLGEERARSLDPLEFRLKCRYYAQKHVDIQREEFKRLGIFGHWDAPYLTMTKEYEATIARELGQFAHKGHLYKGKKPVHWCASCRTALAEAEVEHKDHDSPSIYVKFRYLGDPAALAPELAGKKVSFVIWTTTPWTLPANLGIALNPRFNYTAYEQEGEALIMAEDLARTVHAACGMGEPRKLAEVDSSKAEKTACQHPFIDRESLLVFADYVTLEAGTGCVHTAPGHGQEDYGTGQRYGLDIYAPVDDAGRFTDEVPEYAGRHVFETNGDIVKRLAEDGALLNKAGERMAHSYPHCWRCKEPVIFRATPQWFAALDHNDLRKRALAQVDATQWVPAWGHDRIYGMIENRPDWCLSRQRTWGVPIPVLYCEDCGEALASGELIDHVADLFAEEGSDAWYARAAVDLLPEGTACPRCQSTAFRKETDIVDVWFESGVSWAAVCEGKDGLWPIDLYLEGSDQHRGWFHSAMLTSVAGRDVAPYKTVLTHGFVVNDKGEPYSKSLKNFIPPEKVIKTRGAELFRLWTAYVDYRYDMPFSEAILGQLGESYRKLRNTVRFLIGNLGGYEPDSVHPEPESPDMLDRWALDRLDRVLARCRTAYEAYEFHTVFKTLMDFCTTDLSSFYLDVIKDRMYCAPAGDAARKSTQVVLYRLARALATVMAPILSFTAEEIWAHLPRVDSDPESIHLAAIPEPGELDHELDAQVAGLRGLRELVLKQLEPFRAEKHHPLDARVTLTLTAEGGALARAYGLENLADLFIVSEVVLAQGDAGAESSASVSTADGIKCPRCWKLSAGAGDARHDALCPRCSDALRVILGEG